MNVFNSLGSNYNLSYVISSLVPPKKDSADKLIDLLEKKYGGRATLFYKGREAITAAIGSLRLTENSQIAINGFTCIAVFNAIRKAGLEPVCLDLEKSGGLNFTPKTLENALKTNTKIRAVVIQNTLGYPCDIEKIEAICKKNKLVLIEDLAHCVGTHYKDGRDAGKVGDITIFSFSQDKIIDAVSGGALVIKNSEFRMQNSELKRKNSIRDRLYPAFTYKIRFLYPFGLGKPYHFLLKKLHLMTDLMNEGFYNYYSLPSWNAYIAIREFKMLDKQLSHRRKISQIYTESLPDSIFMFDREKTSRAVELSANLRFPIFVENRPKLLNTFKKHGAYLSDIWYSDIEPNCSNAVADSKIILNLPTHINVSEENARKISQIINLWLKQQK